MSGRTSRHQRRTVSVIGVLCAVILAAVVGWWAAAVTLGDAGVEDEGTPGEQEVWAAASHESVGRSLNLSTTVRQPSEQVGSNRFPGIVREVQDGQLDNGELVYRVGSAAVRVIESDAPFWRDLEQGNSGEDVTAVQEFLIETGYLQEGEAHGEFDQVTAAAVGDWQEDLGAQRTGTVPLGEVVAVPQTPVVIQLGESIRVGAELSGGEESVLAPTGERSFVLVLMDSQAQQVPMDATVEIAFDDYTWEAVIESVSEGDPAAGGGVEYQLTGPDGGEVCGEHCDELPADAQLSLRSSVVVSPPVEGPAIPAAAVRTAGDGDTYVETRDGEVQVEVLGSGQGVAIIEGVDEGTEVRVFSDSGTGTGQLEQGPESDPAAPDSAEHGEPGEDSGDSSEPSEDDEGDPGHEKLGDVPDGPEDSADESNEG
ncbi:peptidoglycan-binding domain-containing protein [Nesterenkonia muleiensis]|uniref:peptidoglycan-binding domain-containing protein n=1 Tax=Nesterenkonia muleiensis TaxID=2282648 RepID=UPI000E7170C1|nr:peptidoglycan-binding domain-containing protein [Nesterenkonia muleiensis]